MRHTLTLLVLLFTGAATAAEQKLKVGDPAPPLNVEKWISGGPVVLAEGKDKTIHVVEFWATWCGPCIRSIPHLTKIGKHFEKHGVKIVGVSIDGERTRPQVEPFVKKMGKKMDYAVALDRASAEEEEDEKPVADGKEDKEDKEDKNGKDDRDGKKAGAGASAPTTGEAYLEAAGVRGIPHAFIVGKDGKVAWHGHPAELGLQLAEMVGDEAYAERERKADRLREKLQSVYENEKYAEAASLLAELYALDPDDGLLLMRYHLLQTKTKDQAGAAKLAEEIIKSVDDPEVLNQFSWEILDNEEFEGARDRKVVLAAAKKANDLTGGKDWSIVDTYARALFETGEKKTATELQRKSVALAEEAKVEEDQLSALKKSLERYESGREDGVEKEPEKAPEKD